jgi:DNA-binding NarL/FixJ family response regulator
MKILSVDDHPLFGHGLKELLTATQPDFEVVSIQDPQDALIYAKTHSDLDILILDLSMPQMGGISFMRALISRDIYVPVVIMSASEDLLVMQQALELGAVGILSKLWPVQQLIDSIEKITQGETVIPSHIATGLSNMSKFAEENTQSILSKRQLEILKMVQAGLSNNGIASVLYISEFTVKSHLQTIFRILGAKNRVDSVRKAENLNIFPKKV